MKPEHRRFLLVHQTVVPAVFNFVLNGAIAWLLFRGVSEVPLWGESSAGVDLLATAFLLPFLTCLIVSRIVGRQVRSGHLAAVDSRDLPPRGASSLSVSLRGIALGVVAIAVAAAPVVVALERGGWAPLPVGSFVAFKAVWAALLAAAVSPLIAWWALQRASREGAAPLRAA